MWFRVDDHFLEHPKVLAAADCLGGARPLGRIAAVWLEAGLYVSRYLTDGFVPRRAAAHFRTDRLPLQVLNACVRSGLFTLVDDPTFGYRFHDWHAYNPSAEQVHAKRHARQTAGRAGGLRSAERRKHTPEHTSQHRGKQMLKLMLPLAPANGPAKSNPVPLPQDPDQKQSPAWPATRRLLERIAHGALDAVAAGELDPLDVTETLKTHAAKCGLTYDAAIIARAEASARAHRRRLA